ncbi:MAG: type IV secretion system DNA-binding domain-containing protein [Candidatus Nealsonbacteria bacterium]|nr:type IV secretion system DNA-binding domain-containing protein [Candidatus Nealsonbacteria bacterium]
MFSWSYLIILVFALTLIAIFSFLSSKSKEKTNIFSSFDTALFLVMMPKHEISKEEGKQKEEKELIGQMEQIYTDFLYLKKERMVGTPRITFEIASCIGGTDISFYVAVPKSMETAFEKYVQGVYPGALIERVPQDYTIFEPAGFTAGSYLKLRETPFLPISTYKNLEKDPLASLTNSLSKIKAEEGAAIQVVIKSIASQKKWKKIGDKILSKIKEGKTLNTSIGESSRSGLTEFFIEFVNIFAGQKPKAKKQEETDELKSKGLKVDEATIKAIQEKIQKQTFETNIRLITSAQSQERAEEILDHLEGVFGQFSLSSLNGFETARMNKKNLHKLAYDFSFRNFNPNRKMILNVEELTSIYHFPTVHTETPYIKTAKSNVSAPPADLPDKGLNLIGKVAFRGEERKVYFASRNDRRRHFYLIGQTGTGKSSLLREMIRQDIENGEGVAVIDPHGELIEDVLSYVPKERAEDVVLFEPFDLERPVGLNMLEYDTPEQKDFAVQEMIAIFYKLFPPEIIGPMFEHYMRNAMLALMADKDNPGTLVEIPRMFTDEEFMQEKLGKVSDAMVRNFWMKEWKQTTGSTRSDMLGYVVSKVGRFIENEMMRNIIGQSHCGFDLAKIMDEGKIFLANLSKGLTGEVNSSLLGLILVSKMQMAAMKRARVPEEQRKDFYLYIDEFQNFTTDSIATILSEARKYRLNLIMAHQYIPQLRPEIRNAVLGNVGTTGAFRIGAEDAEFLEKQFAPDFSKFDLINLDNFNVILKMMINNKISSAFKMELNRPKEGRASLVEPIKELSKLKYGRPRGLVEAEISERSKLI